MTDEQQVRLELIRISEMLPMKAHDAGTLEHFAQWVLTGEPAEPFSTLEKA